jgi:hypothetical protein
MEVSIFQEEFEGISKHKKREKQEEQQRSEHGTTIFR